MDPMSIHYEIQILRSKLIAMTRLTQRTVDYSIKQCNLAGPSSARDIQDSKDEMSAIRCRIASHSRELLETGVSGEADSRFACAALRISGALEVAYDSAVEISQQIETRFATEWIPVCTELEDAGQFVNSLFRLCVLSLLNRDVRHAKVVLHNQLSLSKLNGWLWSNLRQNENSRICFTPEERACRRHPGACLCLH
jgi:hypothetical protein